MDTFNWVTAATIFVVYICFDILYALYVLCVSRQQPIMSASVSTLLLMLGAYGVRTYVNNIWYVIPLAAGAFLGTYVAVKYMGNWHK